MKCGRRCQSFMRPAKRYILGGTQRSGHDMFAGTIHCAVSLLYIIAFDSFRNTPHHIATPGIYTYSQHLSNAPQQTIPDTPSSDLLFKHTPCSSFTATFMTAVLLPSDPARSRSSLLPARPATTLPHLPLITSLAKTQSSFSCQGTCRAENGA
jgi:hypothetical protein